MVQGLGPLDLSDPRSRKLKTETAGPPGNPAQMAIISAAVQNRSVAASAVNASVPAKNVHSGNVFFSKAIRINMKPGSILGRDASLFANFQRAAGQRARGLTQQWYQAPSLATYNQAQVAYKQSTASSIGEALGALGGLAVSAASAGKTMGLWGGESKSKQVDKATEALGSAPPSNVSNDVATYINNMQNCTTAAQLSSNIAVAEDQLRGMNTNITSLESLVNDYKTKASELTDAKTKSSKAVGTAQKGVETAQKSLGEQQSIVNGSQEKVNELDKQVAQVSDAYSKAVTNHQEKQKNTAAKEQAVTAAETGVTDAEAALNLAKTTLGPDGQPDQKAISDAEAKLTQAKKDLTDARNARDAAKNEEQDALKAKKEAAQQVADANNEKQAEAKQLVTLLNQMERAEQNVANENKKLDTAKDTLQQAQENLDAVNNEIQNGKAREGMVQEATTNRDTLSQAIDVHKKKLAKMEKTEAKTDAKAAETKAEKKAAKETNIIEENKTDSIVSKALKSSQDTGKTTGGSWQTLTGTDGNKYTKITANGNTYYYNKRSGQQITQQKFEELTKVKDNNAEVKNIYNTV